MGIALKKAGFGDFLILDKGDDLGGTWRDNQYPGCACDVPSPLYSYSFELNPNWSRLFAPQQEIWDYLRMCARKYRVDEHIRYGCTVERMDWDDDTRRWTVVTVEHGEVGSYQARAVVSAAGALHLPSYPDIPGAGSFGGASFHSARWDPSCDLTGQRVAVIGTGASAIQFVPEIAAQAAHLTVFQRTPPWIHPRARRSDPGPAAGRVQRRTADRPRVPGRHLPADGGQGARLRGEPETDGPAGADGPAALGEAGRRPRTAGSAHPRLHDRLQADPAVLHLLSGPAAAERGPIVSPGASRKSPRPAWSPPTARPTRPT